MGVTPCAALLATFPTEATAAPPPASALQQISLAAGECASWAGHTLAYGAAPNDSGDVTISIDFHVIPWSLYRESREKSRRSSHNLRLGGYYAVMDVSGRPAPTEP